MKKILAVFDGIHFSINSINYAAEIAKNSNSLLVGVFIHDISYTRFAYTYSWEIPSQVYLDYNKIEKEDDIQMKKLENTFIEICERKKTDYKIHEHSGIPLMELLKESAFADLILIDTKTSFYSVGDKKPCTFLKDLLAESKCPVLIIPDKSTDIKHVVVAYDGQESSVYAMKMFSYIFPEWSDMDTTIVSVNESTSNHVPRNRDIKDLAQHHFKNVKFKILNGETEAELEKYLTKECKDTVVIMGAYGRSAWSRMFHSSMSNTILKKVKLPLFITHQ